MNEADRILAHRRRWGYVLSDEEAFREFLTRVELLLPGLFVRRFDWYQVYFAYCLKLAQPVQRVGSPDEVHRLILRDLARAPSQRRAADVLFALILGLEYLTKTNALPPEMTSEALEYVKNVLDEASSFSPTVGIRLLILDGQHAIVPNGAGVLDEELVDANLVWLEAHPKAAIAFTNALKTYAEGDKARFRDVLDNLRVALEQVLKGILRNQRSLENQEKEFFQWLKDKGVHTQTRNLVRQVYVAYLHFQNDAVKHDIDYSENEVEFYIYQTGTLLRLLLTLAEAS